MMTDSKTDERGALFVTGESVDPRFNQPYIAVREWRDEPADAPVFPGGITTQDCGAAPVKARHLYVHGGFTGTDAKFSFCFPPEAEYEGRFSQATIGFGLGDGNPTLSGISDERSAGRKPSSDKNVVRGLEPTWIARNSH
jgi:hypothetical protein